jgi:hypothetical protein
VPSISCPYFKTFNIIKSVQRILKVNEEWYNSDLQSRRKIIFLNILYAEFDYILYDLETTIIDLGYDQNFLETSLNREIWYKSRHENNYVLPECISITSNARLAYDLFKQSNDIFNTILPFHKNAPVSIEANFSGFKGSKKYFYRRNDFFVRNDFISICPDKKLRHDLEISKKQSFYYKIGFEKYIDKTFICNRATAEILVTMIHYFSEIKERNTRYELVFTGTEMYQIKVVSSTKPSLDEMKSYWLNYNIINLASKIKIHKFGLIVDYGVEFSTIMSDDTEDDPIEVRLILLNCGHHLGFELIDEFLENFYLKDDEPAMCHICRDPIFILGSYDTVVYRCK